METIELNNGIEMPAEGLGTFLMEPDDADIFDFELTDGEMDRIAQLNGTKRYYQPSQEKLEAYAAMTADYDAQK